MTWFTSPDRSVWRAAGLGWSIGLFLCSCVSLQQASADSGPFATFSGNWTGTGKIQLEDKTERIRCQAAYRVLDSGQRNVKLQLNCESDSYKFDLTGDFQADENNRITGQWSERSRNIGGTAIGVARGDRLQIHVESSALAGNLFLVTRSQQQSVSIDSQGGGQTIKASITLHRGSR